MNSEQELRYWLQTNTKAKTGISNLKWERSLYGAYDLLSREVQEQLIFEPENLTIRPVGRIDLIFTYEGEEYCVELKLLDYTSSNFWDAMKIIGYTILYNWENKTNYIPAVLIPKDKIKLEHHIVANKTNLAIFEITKKEDGYTIKKAEPDSFERTGRHP